MKMSVLCNISHILALVFLVNADVYLHNMRGSNNRLDDDERGRDNANRLFNSQNNDRGGYNVGSLYYYAGSIIPIEWTNQHSCASPNNNCEIVLQYMCDDQLRDGITSETIPEDPNDCENNDCNTDLEYGMQENYDYYLKCKLRSNNKGLYDGRQDLNKDGRGKAVNTRQNPNGNRYGYECPEERDYYPYWHPTPWKDVAILTNNVSRCAYYQEMSQNVRGHYECVFDRNVLLENRDNEDFVIPNNEEDCNNNPDGEWTLVPCNNIATPECRETDFSRDNHLGNTIGGYPIIYNWTVPNIQHEHCAFRIRYNISTNDYENWETYYEDRDNIDVYSRFGFESKNEGKNRGYEYRNNNPQVQIFPGVNVKFQLSINRAQFGRTFQDRSHRFAIRPKPAEITSTIHNVNVRGKRGNIVQVYPGVEYDFVPNTLYIPQGDYVHFQWTGSNTNPENNAGQGTAGTDRSNIVLQRAQAYPEGTGIHYMGQNKYGHWGRSYPEHAVNTTFLGFTPFDVQHLAVNSPGQFGGVQEELDDSGTYYDLGPRKVTQKGVYHYLCTRNNNFSNRSQKGKIICDTAEVVYQAIGYNGGTMSAPNGVATVVVKPGVFPVLHKLQLFIWPDEEVESRLALYGQKGPDGDYASPVVVLLPEHKLTAEGQRFYMDLEVDSSSLDSVKVYRTLSTSFALWTTIDADIEDGRAKFMIEEGGVYVAMKTSSTDVIIGAVVGALVFLIIIVVGTTLYCRRNPEVKNKVINTFKTKV